MKTKIIYISGNEVFNMADIRAAFEEVRQTLGLGTDTVMFGVPVDGDNALATVTPATDTASEPVINDCVNDDNVEIAAVAPAQEHKKTVRKSHAKRAPVAAEDAPVIEPQQTEIAKSDDQAPESDSKIIPILSILASKQSDATQDDATDSDTVITPEVVDEIPDNNDTDMSDEETETAIVDMITEDAPEQPMEKTLEQLLESMTPLREDAVEETDTEIDTEIEIPNDASDESLDTDILDSDSDATLEQLAAEFAENQDKIPEPVKSDTHSKIGKLKNILPFKKAKRDDTGLMGDLFGWAGVAANDDDFSVPGFFTRAASKK